MTVVYRKSIINSLAEVTRAIQITSIQNEVLNYTGKILF